VGKARSNQLIICILKTLERVTNVFLIITKDWLTRHNAGFVIVEPIFNISYLAARMFNRAQFDEKDVEFTSTELGNRGGDSRTEETMSNPYADVFLILESSLPRSNDRGAKRIAGR
jgi:hypothetical protein